MRGKVVIAGVGNTVYGKYPGRDKIELIVDAAREAIEDAGIGKDEIDGVFVKMANAAPTVLYGQKVAEALGLQPAIGCALDQGGAANIGLIAYAALAIEAGMIRNALICYGDTARTGSHAVYHRPRGDDAIHGWYSTAAGYAMIHQAYRQRYRARDEHFGAVAVAARAHGAQNPRAHLRKPLGMDAYLSGPFVVEPLRRDDICLVSDGAAAILLTSAAEARNRRHVRAVPILGLGQAQESWEVHLRPDLLRTRAEASADMAFARAGITRRQIDFAQIYDCFTVTVLQTLEDYGLAPRGQAGEKALAEGLGVDGWLPFNTSGGLLSESGTPGLQLVIEAVRQLRGEANVQVKSPRHGLVSNQGGSMHTHATLILGSRRMSQPEIVETAINAPYWSALRQGRLDYQHCRSCGHDWLPARAHCPACLGTDSEWRAASGSGRLVSWVVYHRAYAPHLAARLPYNIAIVELAEGPRLLTSIVDRPNGSGLFADAAVALRIEEDFGRPLPRFCLSQQALTAARAAEYFRTPRRPQDAIEERSEQ